MSQNYITVYHQAQENQDSYIIYLSIIFVYIFIFIYLFLFFFNFLLAVIMSTHLCKMYFLTIAQDEPLFK